MKRRFLLALATIASLRPLLALASSKQDEQAKASLDYDLKLDQDSAVKIAEVIFVRVYGERVLREKPWKVKSEADDSIFHIAGTFDPTKGARGGVGEIRIKRSNAEVVSITHGK